MGGPLLGIRVIDLTHVLNGPFCTLLLAHLGAEVIKIEYGSGDRFRHAWMPPDAQRDGYEFIAVNSNKKGITLNLKKERGKELFRELVRNSDVVVENFTVGVMDRLDLGYEHLRAVNHRLIYACSRGFGESGPYRNIRANAATIQAISGWTDSAGAQAETPGIKGPGIGDEAAGVSMCLGIVSALYNREKTGKGQKIDISMQEAQLGFMVSLLHTHFEGRQIGRPPKACADGYFAFHVPDMTNELWSKLTQGLGHPELAADMRFATVRDRRFNYAQVEETIADIVRGKTRQELWDVLRPLEISCAPVLNVGEALADEHLQERGAFVELDHPQAGRVKLLAPWIHFSETPGALESPAPLMGQHNEVIYGELLGLSSSQIATLQEEGVV